MLNVLSPFAKIFIVLLISGCDGFSANSPVGNNPVNPTPTLPASELREDSILIATEESVTLPQSGYVLNKIYYSNDLGQNWLQLPRVENQFQTGYLRMLKFEQGQLFIGTGRGFSASDDLGQTWSFFGENPGYGRFSKTTYDVLNLNNTWFAGTIDGLNISVNNGQSWTNVRQQQLGQIPSNTVTGVHAVENDLYVTTLFNVLKSQDQGLTWQDVNYTGQLDSSSQKNPKLKVNEQGLWINDFINGLFLSTDNGQTWQSLAFPDVLPFREHIQDFDFGSDTILGWNTQGYFRSDDNGVQWTWQSIAAITGVADSMILNMSMHKQTALLITIQPSRLYLSTNQGQSWVNITSNLDVPAENIKKAVVPKIN